MSVRLSPAASLLRNSKLFALPPTIALPAAPPSSDQVSSSKTATTVYPQHAAIETTSVSGSRGDWGLKRPLPLKTAKTTRNPSVRLVRGIDAPEHVADFESAADHVLTLRKFQQLHQPIRHSQDKEGADRTHYNVFRPTHDNTTNLSSSSPAHSTALGVWPNIRSEDVFAQLPANLQHKQIEIDEQRKAKEEDAGLDPASGAAKLIAATARSRARPEPTRRWRYAGPSLVQMSGMEFDDYVHNLGQKEKDLLTDRMRKAIIQDKTTRARDEGKMENIPREEEITAGDIANYLRYLRNEPRKFGPILAEMLDIPEAGSDKLKNVKTEMWEYDRDTLATKQWQKTGPPRTHPSAGLSYLQTTAHADNHPLYGPQLQTAPVVGRVVKTQVRAGKTGESKVGVAGFIASKLNTSSTRDANEAFVPRPGGMKIAVRPGHAHIKEDGTLQMTVQKVDEYTTSIKDDKAVPTLEIRKEAEERAKQEARNASNVAPPLSHPLDSYQPRPRLRSTVREQRQSRSDEAQNDVVAQLMKPRRL